MLFIYPWLCVYNVNWTLKIFSFFQILQTAGINLYLSASDRVPVVNFLERKMETNYQPTSLWLISFLDLQLPDTIDSWFNIVALHVW